MSPSASAAVHHSYPKARGAAAAVAAVLRLTLARHRTRRCAAAGRRIAMIALAARPAAGPCCWSRRASLVTLGFGPGNAQVMLGVLLKFSAPTRSFRELRITGPAGCTCR